MSGATPAAYRSGGSRAWSGRLRQGRASRPRSAPALAPATRTTESSVRCSSRQVIVSELGARCQDNLLVDLARVRRATVTAPHVQMDDRQRHARSPHRPGRSLRRGTGHSVMVAFGRIIPSGAEIDESDPRRREMGSSAHPSPGREGMRERCGHRISIIGCSPTRRRIPPRATSGWTTRSSHGAGEMVHDSTSVARRRKGATPRAHRRSAPDGLRRSAGARADDRPYPEARSRWRLG